MFMPFVHVSRTFDFKWIDLNLKRIIHSKSWDTACGDFIEKWLKISYSMSIQVYSWCYWKNLWSLKMEREKEVMKYSTMALWFDDQKCMGLECGMVWKAKSCGKCTNSVCIMHRKSILPFDCRKDNFCFAKLCTHGTYTRHTFHMDNLTCEFSLFYFQICYFDCLVFLMCSMCSIHALLCIHHKFHFGRNK